MQHDRELFVQRTEHVYPHAHEEGWGSSKPLGGCAPIRICVIPASSGDTVCVLRGSYWRRERECVEDVIAREMMLRKIDVCAYTLYAVYYVYSHRLSSVCGCVSRFEIRSTRSIVWWDW